MVLARVWILREKRPVWGSRLGPQMGGHQSLQYQAQKIWQGAGMGAGEPWKSFLQRCGWYELTGVQLFLGPSEGQLIRHVGTDRHCYWGVQQEKKQRYVACWIILLSTTLTLIDSQGKKRKINDKAPVILNTHHQVLLLFLVVKLHM